MPSFILIPKARHPMKILFTFLVMTVMGQTYGAVDTIRYTILTSDKISGKQLKWSDGPGKVSYFFEFNDRGRGPRLKVDLTLDNDQVIGRKAVGVDYYKGAVDETYEISNGVAKWKNKIEEGQKNVSGPVLYSALNAAPGEIEWSLKTLMKQHHHVDEMDVLPLGKLSTVHVKSHTARVNGFPEELELHSFTGSGGAPFYVWVTPKKDFFATIGNMSIIRLGYEFLVPELKKLQDAIEDEYFFQQALGLTQKQNTPVAIVNAGLFDSKTGKVLPDHTIIIDKGKITQVGKSKSIQVPQNCKVIAGNGKMILPGLWDNHVHFGRSQGLYHLAAGVTNVKDMANSPELPDLKKKIDNDDLLGPEISIWSGFIDFAGPYAGPGKTIKTLEEGIAAVNLYADRGYQQVKLYSSIPVDWVKPMAAEAHKRGLKVVGHVPSGMTAERAVNDGYDQVIHLNMIMLNFLGDTIDTRSMGRFIKVAERARNIDLNSAEVKRFVKLLKDKNIVVDPTIAIFEQMFTNEPGKLAAGYDKVLTMLPSEIKRAQYEGGLPTMKGHEAEYRQSYDKMLKMLQLLYANKIMFVPGTDDFPGFMLHRELEVYSQAGIPNKEVLQKATYYSAKVAGKDSELGSIEVGKKANLILVDGDPVKNISDIRKVELTIKNGNLYDTKTLYKSYGFGFWK